MARTHPLRRFCRFILSSERSEARERARVASLRKGTGASLRGDSGSIFAKPPFDWLILVTIVASTIVLAIDSPVFILNNPRSSALFQVANLVFTIIFIAEFVLRAIADGLWFTPKAYFRQPWNVFDFVLLVAQCIDVFYFAGSQSSQVRARSNPDEEAARVRAGLTAPAEVALVWWGEPTGHQPLLPCGACTAAAAHHQSV
jgi:hypothetical protein